LFVATAILFVAVATGLGAFWFCTYFGTKEIRATSSNPDAELVWLRREFHLTDAQFQRIRALHTAYTGRCDLMCQRIMQSNSALETAISKSRGVTPEIQRAMEDAAQVQRECQESMLAHIYEVSEQMEPSSGKRYLQMMMQKIIQPGLPSNTAITQ
jgi:hypothetical protein